MHMEGGRDTAWLTVSRTEEAQLRGVEWEDIKQNPRTVTVAACRGPGIGRPL